MHGLSSYSFAILWICLGYPWISRLIPGGYAISMAVRPKPGGCRTALRRWNGWMGGRVGRWAGGRAGGTRGWVIGWLSGCCVGGRVGGCVGGPICEAMDRDRAWPCLAQLCVCARARIRTCVRACVRYRLSLRTKHPDRTTL
jgi:hypothetical protein